MFFYFKFKDSFFLFFTFLFFLTNRTNSLLVSEKWDDPICQENKCITNLTLELNLGSDDRYFETNWNKFTDSSDQVIFLENNLYLRIEREISQISYPLIYLEEVYNVYEEWDQNSLCNMGLDYGKCSSYNNMPPSKQTSNQEATGDADRSETFRLCCINSPRGDGVHCLRYDYSSKYLSYSIGKPFVTHQLNMLLEKNSLQYETISLSKFDNTKESQEENDDWEAELMITQGDPDCSDKLQHFSDSYYFFQETNIAFENEYYRWFLIKKNDESINKINLDPLTFSLLASCEDEYHSQTRTHYEDDTTDQFQVWRQFRIDNFLTEIQNSVNVDNEIQVIQDQNNQPKNMRIQFSQNPENSLVKIILKNIITKQ